jgi:hypothetical protein
MGNTRSCINREMEEAADLKHDEIQNQMEGCHESGKSSEECYGDLKATHGDSDDFQRDLDAASKGALSDSMTDCMMSRAPDEEGVTDDVWNAAEEECAILAKTAFINAGGHADGFEMATEDAAEQEAATQMRTCVARHAGRLLTTSAEMGACKSEAKTAYEMAGGKKDFERAQSEGATKVAAEQNERCMRSAASEEDGLACVEAAKLEFVAAGGNTNDFDLALESGAKDSAVETFQLCAQNAGGDAGKLVTCDNDAHEVFVNAGGDAAHFIVARKQGASEHAAAQSELCDEAGSKACYESALKAFKDAGGDENHYDIARAEGARTATTDSVKTCFRAKVAECEAIGTDTHTCFENASRDSSCKEAAKTVFVAAGGDASDYEREQQKGASEVLAQGTASCVRASAADAANPTDEEVTTCKDKAKIVFEESGGDSDLYDMYQKRGATSEAVELLAACSEGATSDADTTTCKETAKQAFKQAGGDEQEFTRAVASGAKSIAIEKKEACIEAKASGFSELATATDCDVDAKAQFVSAGGDEAEYGVALREAVAAVVAETKAACMSTAGVEATSCEESAKEIAKELGLDTEAFERVEQDGARERGATVLEACAKSAATDEAKGVCKTTAKAEFVKSGGDEAHFAIELKRGASQLAADTQKTCIKGAAGDATAIDGCQDTAKQVFVRAGGEELDFWASTKAGLLDESVIKYDLCMEGSTSTETSCSTEAKNYFTSVLNAPEGDWSETDFANKKLYSKVATTLVETPNVDVRFEVNVDASITLAILDSNKAAVETKLEEELLGKVTKVECNGATELGSKKYVVCRAMCTDQATTTVVNEGLRSGTYNSAVATAAGASRRLGATRRKLSIDSVDSSVVSQEVPATSTTTDSQSTPTESPSTPESASIMGPVIGGVCGGLALLAVAAVVLTRNNKVQKSNDEPVEEPAGTLSTERAAV